MKIVVHDFFSLFRPVLHYQNARTPNRIGQIIFSNRVVWPSWWSRFCRKYDFFHYIFFFPKNSQTLSPSQDTRMFYRKHKLYKNCKRLFIFIKLQRNKKLCEKAKNFAKKQKTLQSLQKNTKYKKILCLDVVFFLPFFSLL